MFPTAAVIVTLAEKMPVGSLIITPFMENISLKLFLMI